MKRINLHKLNVPPISTVIFIYLLSSAIWFGSYFVYQYPNPMTGRVGSFSENIISSKSIIAHLISYIFVLANSFILTQMNRKFSFIRTRTLIPSLIYLLLTSTWLQIHGDYISNAASFSLLVAFFFSLGMYKNKLAVEQAFLSSFALSIATLLIPSYLFIIPIFWIGYFILKANSFRIFLASLFGFITPWILALGVYFLLFDTIYIVDDIQEYAKSNTFFSYKNIKTIVYTIFIFIIVALAFIQTIRNSMRDSIQARDQMNFIISTGIFVVLLTVFQFNNYTATLPAVALYLSIQLSYPFALINSKLNTILFYLLFLSSFAFAALTILIPYLSL